LKVKRGDLVVPAWQRLVDFADTLRIFSGPGILISPRLGGGITISALPNNKAFDHPWRASLSAKEALFEPGRVNGIEPTINGIPMSGRNGGDRPRLALSESLFTPTGESWLAIELTRNDAGKIVSLRIVQVERLDSGGDLRFVDGGSPEIKPNVALEPIALLYRGIEKVGFGQLRQIRFFNATWRVNLTNPGGPRHFFA